MKTSALTILLFLITTSCSFAQGNLPLHLIKLPKGFTISLYTADVPNARAMVLTPDGTLFVGTRKKGNVYAVVDKDKDFKADHVYRIAKKLRMPVGVAFKNGSLYVSEVSKILRYDNIEDRLEDPPGPVVVKDDLPSEGWHGWKYIAFGPDGKLYVPIVHI